MKNKEIKNKLDILESKIDLLITPPSERPAPFSLHCWLETWYATYKPPTLSKKWLAVLRNNIDRVKALTIDKPLNEYTPAELLAAVYAVPLSYTRSACYDLLNAAYKQAVRLGYVRCNPLDGTPKIKHIRQIGQALTLDEQRQFIQALDNTPPKAVVYVLFVVGLPLLGGSFYCLVGYRRKRPFNTYTRNENTPCKSLYTVIPSNLRHIERNTPRRSNYIPVHTQRRKKPFSPL